MIICQFIFRPGTYDDEFHALDSSIDAFARSLPGFRGVETWTQEDLVNAIYYFEDMANLKELAQFTDHQMAKSQVERWYEGYRIVVSELVANYGDDRLDPAEWQK